MVFGVVVGGECSFGGGCKVGFGFGWGMGEWCGVVWRVGWRGGDVGVVEGVGWGGRE